jgi:23S rRNA pseudouridine2605 synthase
MILIKYIAKSGLLSRRKSEEAIKNGDVRVNSTVIIDPTYEVNDNDIVYLKNKKIEKSELVYVVLNKPVGYITAKDDPQGREIVSMIFPPILRKFLDPIGRLDYNTSGSLLFSNDGDFVYRLSHPKFNVRKIYQVVASKPLTEKIVEALKRGVKLEDTFIKPDSVKWNEETPTHFMIELHSGKYRIIRRLLEVFGIFVKKLHRSSFAGINVRGMSFGDWRYLKKSEIEMLKEIASKGEKLDKDKKNSKNKNKKCELNICNKNKKESEFIKMEENKFIFDGMDQNNNNFENDTINNSENINSDNIDSDNIVKNENLNEPDNLVNTEAENKDNSEGEAKNNSEERSFDRPRREFSGERREGGFRRDRNDRNGGGFRRDRNDRNGGGFRRDRSEGGFRRDRNEGGFNRGPRRDFGDRKPFGSNDEFKKDESGVAGEAKSFDRPRREFNGERREGGFRRDRNGGGFNRGGDRGGFSRGGDRGGFNRGPRRDFGDRKPFGSNDEFKKDESGVAGEGKSFDRPRREFSGERREGGFRRDRNGGGFNRGGDRGGFSRGGDRGGFNRGPRRDFGDKGGFRNDKPRDENNKSGYVKFGSDELGSFRKEKRDFTPNFGKSDIFGDKKPRNKFSDKKFSDKRKNNDFEEDEE